MTTTAAIDLPPRRNWVHRHPWAIAISTILFFVGGAIGASGSSTTTKTVAAPAKTVTHTKNVTHTKTIAKTPKSCITTITMLSTAASMVDTAVGQENRALAAALGAGNINLAVPAVRAAARKVQTSTAIVNKALAPAIDCKAHA